MEHCQLTFYCNSDHITIKTVAAQLQTDLFDQVAIARRTFYFVRDQIRFGFDCYHRKASETLKRGFGACWNKSLLLTALLRCNDIPAQFGAIPLKRSFIRPAIGPWHFLANTPFHHCLVHAYLNQRWTVLDVPLDKGTFETFFRPAGVTWKIGWNGTDDVCLYTESVAGSPAMYPDIDNTIEKKVGNRELPTYLAVIGYRYMNRKMWQTVDAHSTGSVVRPSVRVS